MDGNVWFSLASNDTMAPLLICRFFYHTDSRDPYTEAEAARITSAILSAISYVRDIEFVFFRVFVF